MSRKGRVPAYQRHKHSGQACVKLNGEFTYLGPHGSKVSLAEYDRVILEWLANGRRAPARIDDQTDRLICELCAAYWEFARGYYVKDSQPSGEQHHIRLLVGLLSEFYGRTAVSEFSPLRLKALRQRMIGLNNSRIYINNQIGRARRIFKWGVENELVPPAVYQALQAVAGLRKGRSAARETEPVKPVAVDYVEASKPFVSRQVWAMIRIELLAGMRPGEVCIMRACDIEMDGDVWNYRPHDYKTEHHDIERIIPLGQRAQAIVREFLKPDSRAYLFSPIDAEAERRAKLHAERKTPLSCGNRPGTNRKRKPKRLPGERYDSNSYRRAIQRACRLAFPAPDGLDAEQTKRWHKEHRWSPNQLRHTAGTKARKLFGLEGAQVHLGHSKANTTEIYAERNLELAREIARQIG